MFIQIYVFVSDSSSLKGNNVLEILVLPFFFSTIWCADYVGLAYILIWYDLSCYPWYGWPARKTKREERKKGSFSNFVENIFSAKDIRYLCQILLIYTFSVINGIDEFLVCYLIFNVFTLTIRKIGLCGRSAFALCVNGERVSVCRGFSVSMKRKKPGNLFSIGGSKVNVGILFATRKHQLRIQAFFLCIK